MLIILKTLGVQTDEDLSFLTGDDGVAYIRKLE